MKIATQQAVIIIRIIFVFSISLASDKRKVLADNFAIALGSSMTNKYDMDVSASIRNLQLNQIE
ncbi:hypothetical protein H6G17_13780 [Chroococcidiopsis sp. FACHB-1243]|uniref:hypothetical protein n=1 Tax=Chroococcidiopsis sp. [FACHB-1243] TaxID=2692781 RepID=UPI001782EBBF|nr:hypothetical protein [Chroococcidiopsis sp. [FACHB-1243]]MBD2306578.1 hypothetical protein [Chroococcidiopsis sp. [FACHB-1243]]